MATLTRIDIRVEEIKKRVIAKAAELNGQNLTQYIMGLVWADAEKRVNQDTSIERWPTGRLSTPRHQSE